MSAKNYRSLLKWVVTVLIAVLAAGGLYAYFTEDGSGVPLGPASLIGWAIPLAGVFVIVAISWFLLLREQYASRGTEIGYVSCASCGQSVGREWRICPYCGSRPGGSSGSAEDTGRDPA